MMHRAVAPLLSLVRAGRAPWRALVVLCVACALAVGGTASGSPLGAFTTFKEVAGGGGPNSIALGPDGNMWSTESSGNKVARITPSGAVTDFRLPIPGAAPNGIAAGPDGAMWFAERTGNRIGRITMNGAITEFLLPTAGSSPAGIAPGPDGAMWFTQRIGNKIGRIDMAGAVTEFPVPTPASAPWEIAAGVDGSMWFSEWETSRIARVGTGRGALLVARVTGRRSVGARLTCARTNRSPWAVASTSYTWMRGGTAIRGATRRTYTVASRDSGRRISCRAAVTLRPALTRFGAQSRAVPIR